MTRKPSLCTDRVYQLCSWEQWFKKVELELSEDIFGEIGKIG